MTLRDVFGLIEWTGFAISLVDHLWQSSLFILAVALLVRIVGPHHPTGRHALWFVASIKFLVPIDFLIEAGYRLGRSLNPPAITSVEQLSGVLRPASHAFLLAGDAPASAPTPADVLAAASLAIWVAGMALAVIVRRRQWRRLMRITATAPVLSAGREVDSLRRVFGVRPTRRELTIREVLVPCDPGVIGIFKPVLLWPAGLSPRIRDDALDAIMAHEQCHLLRRDNLTFRIHLCVEVIFWFHPGVWWIGKKLVDESERACDQEVVSRWTSRLAYAQGVLAVCRFCLHERSQFVSGIAVSHVTERVEHIMTTPARRPFGKRLWFVITAAAVMGLASPVVTGVDLGSTERRTMLKVPDVSGPIAWRLPRLSPPAPGLPQPSEPVPSARVPRPSADRVRQDTPAVQEPLIDDQSAFRLGAFPMNTPGLVAAVVKEHVRPIYTAEASRAGVQGEVEMDIVIAVDGTVARARVLNGLDPGLDTEALKAAKKWLFEPATLNGQPVPVFATLRLSFRIF
jgi:TonB family protein